MPPTDPEFPRGPGDVTLCTGCRPQNACHLGITAMWLDPAEHLFADVTCPPRHASMPGIAHGGWIASVFDDVLGELPLRLAAVAVTKTLTVDYLAPTPAGAPLRVRSWVARREGRRWTTEGELTAADGTVHARATAQFVQLDPERLRRHLG